MSVGIQAAMSDRMAGIQSPPIMAAQQSARIINQQRVGAVERLAPLPADTLKNAKIYVSNTRHNETFESSQSVLLKNIAYERALGRPAGAFQPISEVRPGGTVSAGSPTPESLTAVEGSKGASSIDKPSTGCTTCASRVYQDGSHDSGVSYQSPQGMPTSLSGVRVASHEGEHATRETNKAHEDGAVVVQKKVTMQMAFCPDCGRMYMAGGTTTITTMQKPKASPSVTVQSAEEMLGRAGENADMYA